MITMPPRNRKIVPKSGHRLIKQMACGLLLVPFLWFIASFSVGEGDGVEKLIDEKKEEMRDWSGGESELPEGYFLGDQSGIEIYSNRMDHTGGIEFCQSLALDELIDALISNEQARQLDGIYS